MPDFSNKEEKILEFWKKKDIFRKSQRKNKEKKLFRWLEGPPTANGLPHMGHVLTRSIKDVFLRYKWMQGFHVVPRIAGWDTHGLPVEREVEKKLNLNDKKDVEKYGIKEFNQKCKDSVFIYEKAWRDMTRRIGFWVDMDNPYVTMHETYIESVWWALKQMWDKDLIYLGHKVVPYCSRCGTPLSSHEAGQGMKETTDPSIYIKFKAKDFDDTYFLAWTTTPWTLISNVCLSVHPNVDYVLIKHDTEKLILAKTIAKKLFENYEVLDEFKGSDLEYKEYKQLFPYIQPQERAFFVTLADYVSTEDGSGIVHSAPAFGEDDAETGRKYELPFINPVLEDGTFDERIKDFAHLHVKKADPKIIKDLKERNLLFKQETVKHTYPFCYRCDSPLLYYSTPTWYIKMTEKRDELLRYNDKINWYPHHLKHGRFGNFIDSVRDWALSRNRFWGTPLPIWECKNGHYTFLGSLKELKNYYRKELPKDFSLHRPWVDEIKFDCPECGKTAQRVPYVIDCWYDSGSAPFAQYHYPFENKEMFQEHFPFDFITEALDQTRGWFYTLHAISTVIFNKPAYKNCLTMGLILDEKGNKMSKSKGNVVSPDDVIPTYGADATRWYLFSNPTWSNARFSPELVRQAMQKFMLTLWNSYSFFISNSNVDAFNPLNHQLEMDKRPELDRWLLSELNFLIQEVQEAMEQYSVHLAVQAFENFTIDKLSNWYLRQSRRRFWRETIDEDKISAYLTTYETFVKITKLLAPFIPFLSEQLYENLVKNIQPNSEESIHLCYYPKIDQNEVNKQLSQDMNKILSIVTAGRSIRAQANIKLRQPLGELIVIAPKGKENLIHKYEQVLMEELNVKSINIKKTSKDLVSYLIKPNFPVLAPKVTSAINKIKKHLENLSSENAQKYVEKLESNESFAIEVAGKNYELTLEDVEYHIQVTEGFEGEEVEGYQILFDTTITPELKQEGYVRDIIRRIQTMRKDLDLEYTQNIEVSVKPGNFGKVAIEQFKDFIKKETLAAKLTLTAEPKGKMVKEWEFDDYKVKIGVIPK